MPKRHDVTGRSKKGSPFVQIPKWVMQSHAWRRLTPADRCVWLELTAVYNGTNNGYIAAPVRALGDRLNVSHHTAARCLRNLVTLGFVEITAGSNFSKKNRTAAEYRLTHLECDRTHQPAKKTFMRLVDLEKLRTTVSSQPSTVSRVRL